MFIVDCEREVKELSLLVESINEAVRSFMYKLVYSRVFTLAFSSVSALRSEFPRLHLACDASSDSASGLVGMRFIHEAPVRYW
jgi:hypothetical protein